MKIVNLIGLTVLAALSACSKAEVSSDCMERLKTTVSTYVETLPSKRISNFTKKLDERIAESDLSEQPRMNQIMLDWFNDHKKQLENPDKFKQDEVEEVCLMIKRVFDHNLDFPAVVKDEFTNEDIKSFCDFLDDQIRKK